MRFSIIMPTMGKRKDFLAKSIEAILSQSFTDFELIIKNGGEPFEVPNDPRIVYVEKKDTGIADAMNQGMEIAKGEIICEANDDDYLRPEALEIVDREIGDAMWLYGLINYGDAIYGSTWNFEKLKQGNYIGQPAVFWKRGAYEKLGGQDTDAQLAADYEYILRLGKNFEPVFIPIILADYNLHEGQITNARLQEQIRDAQKVKAKYQ